MRILITLIFLLAFGNIRAQTPHQISPSKRSAIAKVNFDGQWRGGFNEKNYFEDITYVLELDVNGSQVGGYSYTYFNEPPKKYYTICRITGTLNRLTGDLVVTEVERLKYNTPPTFINCFQTHRLRYEEKEGEEVLRGTWIPAPNQQPGCGSGVTVLTRRPPAHAPMASPQTAGRTKPITPQRSAPSTKSAPSPRKQAPQKKETEEQTTAKAEKPGIAFPKNKPVEIPAPPEVPTKKEPKRRTDIVKTLDIHSSKIRLDFYDNGEIDGDSISVYYNGKVVLSKQMLTDKPLTIYLEIDDEDRDNVLTMYAENLGTIPPNTAVMIVTDGNQRHEVRLESDLKKSGSVIFRRRH